MQQELKVLNIDDWNNREYKAPDTDTTAKDIDIVVQIGDVMFLVERTNNANNIICQSLNCDKSDLKSIRAMFQLCVYLWETEGIEYIRIEGNSRRYRFLERIFPRDTVIKDDDYTERNVYYCNLRKAHDKLVELITN